MKDLIGLDNCGFCMAGQLVFIGSTSERKPKIGCKLGLGMAYVRPDRRRRQLLVSRQRTQTSGHSPVANACCGPVSLLLD